MNKLEHPLGGRWKQMIQRCENPKNKDYPYYGGRGITVSLDWHDFLKFVSDMMPSYRAGLTLERKNNQGSYSKENCLWATRKEQRANRRVEKNAIVVEFNGVKKPLKQWAKDTGVKYNTLLVRKLSGKPVITKKDLE